MYNYKQDPQILGVCTPELHTLVNLCSKSTDDCLNRGYATSFHRCINCGRRICSFSFEMRLCPPFNRLRTVKHYSGFPLEKLMAVARKENAPV